jgi:hypothetical protein
VKVGGVASYFATAVPNCGNGGNLRIFDFFMGGALVSIAKHWGISL